MRAASAMPPIAGLRVVRSSIHGYGVIATRDFALGEVIAYCDGVPWHVDEERDDTYSLWITDELYFDMVDQTRYVNHSCDPNAEVEADVGEDGQPWARMVAIKPIAEGEEITYDYAFPADLAEPCRCEAACCRGLIVDPDELSLVADTAAPAARGGRTRAA